MEGSHERSQAEAESAEHDVLRLGLAAMGTRFELVLPGTSPALRAAGEAALDEVREADGRWSLFRRDSFLAHLQRSAGGDPVSLDEDDFELLEASQRVFAASEGAFDPCVAPLLARAGFARPRATQEAARGTFASVELDRGARAVRLAAGLALDLGGIAKGHALDRAIRALREAGVEQALLHGGTSAVVGLGCAPDGQPWRVSIGSDPGAPVAELVDAALAVSAGAGQTSSNGTTHVVDPATGQGAGDVLAAAVAVSLDVDDAACALADGLATALLFPRAHAPISKATLPPHQRIWMDTAWQPVQGSGATHLRIPRTTTA